MSRKKIETKAEVQKETNLIVNTHLLSIINQLTNHLVDKVDINYDWHEKEAQIAFKMVLSELEYHASILKEDLPKEYLKRCTLY